MPTTALPTGVPEVKYASRNDSVGTCDRGLRRGFWRDLIAEDFCLCSRVLTCPRDTCQRASSGADECGCHKRFRRRCDGVDGHFPASCLPTSCGGDLLCRPDHAPFRSSTLRCR